ncbi:hypothetical protein TNCT_146801 [Trichonephila clavata]|uniref:Uncharacterized protein n=1 Tax=Trichonephila clavata TaxID=2740835 RepID=A0A8X6HCR1_TRICU|nr:hypothetical protein TNCT_146801 [Trichonephila clavata]
MTDVGLCRGNRSRHVTSVRKRGSPLAGGPEGAPTLMKSDQCVQVACSTLLSNTNSGFVIIHSIDSFFVMLCEPVHGCCIGDVNK